MTLDYAKMEMIIPMVLLELKLKKLTRESHVGKPSPELDGIESSIKLMARTGAVDMTVVNSIVYAVISAQNHFKNCRVALPGAGTVGVSLIEDTDSDCAITQVRFDSVRSFVAYMNQKDGIKTDEKVTR